MDLLQKKISGTEICIYLNEKLAGIFETLGYDCNIGMLKRSTIFNMVKENRMKIKHGDVEVFVIMTYLDVFTGYLN